MHLLCLGAQELQGTIELTLKSTWVRAPSGPPLALITGYGTGRQSFVWKMKREAPEERPQKSEQDNTETGTMASSTGFYSAVLGELRSTTWTCLRFTAKWWQTSHLSYFLMLGVAWINNPLSKFMMHVKCKFIAELRSHWKMRIRH